MRITVDTQGSSRLRVIKDGEPVGLVQEVDTDTKTMKRYSPAGWLAWQRGGAEPPLLEEPYDELLEMAT